MGMTGDDQTRAGRGPRANPYDVDDVASRRSYHGLHDGVLIRLRPVEAPAQPVVALVHQALRALILNEHYPCLPARTALRHGDYRVGFYPPLASAEATPAVAGDLWDFVRDFQLATDRVSTFMAVFDGPSLSTEGAFEHLLWAQLQLLHDLDADHNCWDPSVSSEPSDPKFSFSFAQRAFFVVGLHAAASRWARKFAWPTLVFNSHEQFEILRRRGAMTRMEATIRRRDQRLQGHVNPSLASFGDASEARQYSGRLVEHDWTCPFQPKTRHRR